ncbi:MAG: hypothetical protein KTR18_09290 [Acidiferrobacterales bacterium]|nr:hypothetical protein [Acidiferrobacterales bacterium]
MKKISILVFVAFVTVSAATSGTSNEEPVQHLTVPEVTSVEEAKKMFLEKTFEIKSKQTLDESELQEIHIITYSLEKSVAFFAENLTEAGQTLLQQIAVVVENIHLNSENSRRQETQELLEEYFRLVNVFMTNHWTVNS